MAITLAAVAASIVLHCVSVRPMRIFTPGGSCVQAGQASAKAPVFMKFRVFTQHEPKGGYQNQSLATNLVPPGLSAVNYLSIGRSGFVILDIDTPAV
ncbi:MAG: hypothetical protein WBX11_15815 [Thiobacillaceae bacterium]